MSALGNPLFAPGICWNAREETIGPQLLLNVVTVCDRRDSTEFSLDIDTGFETRTKKVNLAGSLALQFMAGALDVKGSAAYLRETCASSNTARVTFSWKSRTRVESVAPACMRHECFVPAVVAARNMVRAMRSGSRISRQ